MKKLLKLLMALLLALIVIGGITFLIDASRVASGKTPICAVEVSKFQDGGTTEYLGIGYRVIDFNMLNGYDEMKIGPWSMKKTDFKEEYEAYNQRLENTANIPSEELSDIPEEVSGDENLEESGELGEEVVEELSSGEEVQEEINENNPEMNPDNPETEQNPEEITEAGEPNSEVEVNEVPEEAPVAENPTEVVGETSPSFVATVVGVNQDTIIVTVEASEPISASANMFSFSNPDTSKTYTSGQKIKVFYTGDISESYPAQVTAISVEVVE